MNNMRLTISDDGMSISCWDSRGIRWRNGRPSRRDWMRCRNTVIEGLDDGHFLWGSVVDEHLAVVIYLPLGKVDFLLKYASASGELLSVDEAR
jgi:hypothetical protein